jgi:hypothetical protein
VLKQIFALGLCVSLLSASLPAKEAETAEKSEAKASTESAGHRSPGVAGGLAFFPGIAVHGAGHMYAGSWIKGLGLLAIEGAAVGIAVANYNGAASEFEAMSKGSGGGKFPTSADGAYTKIGIITVSTMAFLWTWFDDMAGASIAAGEFNKIADEKSQAQLRVEPRFDGAALALSTEF